MDTDKLNHLLKHLYRDMANNHLDLIRSQAVDQVADRFLSRKEMEDFQLKFLEEYVDAIESGDSKGLLIDYSNELLKILKEKNLQKEYEVIERQLLDSAFEADED